MTAQILIAVLATIAGVSILSAVTSDNVGVHGGWFALKVLVAVVCLVALILFFLACLSG